MRWAQILKTPFALAWVVLAAAAWQAQDAPGPAAFAVLDQQPAPGPRITGYLEYQLDRAWAQDERRVAAWAAVRSAPDLSRLKRQTREQFLVAIGGLPEVRTPLNARVVGVVERQDYRIDKVIFESAPGFHVTALVYVPHGPSARRPAVLVACGHSAEGKAFRAYQEISARLAERGYVVLCWDPVGQGERSQFWDAARGRSRYNLICGEHAVLGNLAYLVGANLSRWTIWDGMRAVDYLLTRNDVDPHRISITGTSGGGFQAASIGALDERVAAVAPSCFVTSLPMRMANRIFEDPDSDPEQDPYGTVSRGVDHPGLLLLVHPRPLVIAAAVKDFVPIEGTRRTFREVSAIYRRFGAPDRIALVEGFHEHRFSDENQDAVFAFLDRFNSLPERHRFGAFTPLSAETLRCTASGQVRVDLPGRSLMEIIRERYHAERGRERESLSRQYHANPYPGIERWPVVAGRVASARQEIAFELVGSSRSDSVDIDRYLLRHSGGLTMPLLHIHRTGAQRRPVVLDIALEGKAGVDEWPRLLAQVDAGYDIVSFDLRGTGETRMRYRAAGDDPKLAPANEMRAYIDPLSGVLANYVYNSLLTGRAYFLEMIEDVEIALRFSRVKIGATRVVAAGRGEAAALAQAASEALDGVEWRAEPGVASFAWSNAVESLAETWPIQYVMPGGAFMR